MSQLINNSVRSRFEWVEQGKLAFADYLRQGKVLVIPHVEADPELRGKGAAGRLMAGVLDFARENELKVRPVCSYAVTYIRRHAEYHDLLA